MIYIYIHIYIYIYTCMYVYIYVDTDIYIVEEWQDFMLYVFIKGKYLWVIIKNSPITTRVRKWLFWKAIKFLMVIYSIFLKKNDSLFAFESPILIHFLWLFTNILLLVVYHHPEPVLLKLFTHGLLHIFVNSQGVE